MALRLRLAMTCLTALGMAVVIIMVGALFPSVGGTIGRVNVPKGVANLLGGANYGTIAGWMRSEIGAVYGPLVIAATAIVGAVALTAGEEESGVLELVLAHPIERARLIVARAAAVAVTVMIVAGGTWLGLIIGVAAAGGGISVADQAALALQLAFFGLAIGAVAFALASVTGRKDVALGGSGAFAVTAFLINGFAPLVAGVEWLKYLSPFYFYSGHDPIANGVDIGGLVVLALATITLTAVAVAGFRRRDLRT
jgi:ABC-2 type transport system permease protein